MPSRTYGCNLSIYIIYYKLFITFIFVNNENTSYREDRMVPTQTNTPLRQLN